MVTPRPSLIALLVLTPLLLGAHTVELTMHNASQPRGKAVASGEWIAAAVKRANLAFAAAGVSFRVKAQHALGQPGAGVTSVGQRHSLARLAPRDGTIHIFIVSALACKDRKGAWIGGVHWRCRGRKRGCQGRRYIIVSHQHCRPDTLAHELGHYFGLRHTRRPGNLMSSPGRTGEPGFSRAQLRAIRRGLRRAVGRREVRLSRADLPTTR